MHTDNSSFIDHKPARLSDKMMKFLFFFINNQFFFLEKKTRTEATLCALHWYKIEIGIIE